MVKTLLGAHDLWLGESSDKSLQLTPSLMTAFPAKMQTQQAMCAISWKHKQKTISH